LVEIVWQLRGEAGEKRQLEKADIGLAQSIGGLGNNNFVTILERADRKRVVTEGWRLDYRPKIKPSKKTGTAPPQEGPGLLETFTVLYSPPEGFVSPLTLGFVKTKGGDIVLACNPDYRSPTDLKMGGRVNLFKKEGLFVFEKPTLWKRLRHWIKARPGSKI
jgi:acetyl-CoA C-acetyltransferase